jgi:hypothetical protein
MDQKQIAWGKTRGRLIQSLRGLPNNLKQINKEDKRILSRYDSAQQNKKTG